MSDEPNSNLEEIVQRLLSQPGEEVNRHLAIVVGLIQQALLKGTASTSELTQLASCLVRVSELMKPPEKAQVVRYEPISITYCILDQTNDGKFWLTPQRDANGEFVRNPDGSIPSVRHPTYELEPLELKAAPADDPLNQPMQRAVASEPKPDTPTPTKSEAERQAQRNCEDWVTPTGKIVRGSQPCRIDFRELERERALPEGMMRKPVGPPRIW